MMGEKTILQTRCKSLQVISVGVPQVLSEMKQNPDLLLANLDPSDLLEELSKTSVEDKKVLMVKCVSLSTEMYYLV